ncbi:hypothetical protein COV20_04995 [Candidatus Woesearchaeota archaeon CG10_big_fil_rev_8_21_14_0_10_45_16]|nr:MAG: hypothetical protein COV20_04995 [Candidatus Woesearchaeota archaeon CG10_big_fil_rev_8_21_14_0_10_45_16]
MVLEYCADAIALYQSQLVLIERLSEPKGIAIPGGRRDRDARNELESVAVCAIREFEEETGLILTIDCFLGTYDNPGRDPRGPKISDVVYGTAAGTIRNEEGKTRVFLMDPAEIDSNRERFVFDHYQILCDWRKEHHQER